MFKGSIVALVTPMTDDGQVDFEALKDLVNFHVEQGTSAIVAVGTTGESATLPVQEHVDVVKATIEYCNGRIPVLAGNGANSTAESIELTQLLDEVGADGFLTVTPYYNKPSAKGLVAHYKAVAASTTKPVLLYNVPGRTVCDMMPETIIELSAVANIVGVKEATGDLQRLADIRAGVADDFCIVSGDDCTTCDFVLQGGDGVISVTANVAPKLMADMVAAGLAGNATLAKDIDAGIQPLHDAMFVEANPVPVKWAMCQLGLIKSDFLRLPLLPLEQQHHDCVSSALKHAGLL